MTELNDLKVYEGVKYSKIFKESYVKEVKEAFEERELKLLSLIMKFYPREERMGTIKAVVYSEDGDLAKKDTSIVMRRYNIDSIRIGE